MKTKKFILFSSFIYKCQSQTGDRESTIVGYLIYIWSREFLHIYVFSIRCCVLWAIALDPFGQVSILLFFLLKNYDL